MHTRVWLTLEGQLASKTCGFPYSLAFACASLNVAGLNRRGRYVVTEMRRLGSVWGSWPCQLAGGAERRPGPRLSPAAAESELLSGRQEEHVQGWDLQNPQFQDGRAGSMLFWWEVCPTAAL